MRKCFLFSLALLAFCVSRAAAQSVVYSDKRADFYNYKTYKWVPLPDAAPLDELTAEQLTGTLEMELAKKGLSKTQSDSPDLYIGYQIARGNGKQPGKIGLAYGGGGGGSTGSGTVTTTAVRSGQLVLDIYDASKKQLVWRGAVSNPIDPDAKADKRQKHMDKTVEKLLKDYPPKKT